MEKSKSKINRQLERKRSSELIETILASKKNDGWKEVAAMLSGPRKNRMNINLGEISKTSKDGETIVVAGKVLSQGELDKKIKFVALAFSEKARDKIMEAKSSAETILDEIKKNPSAKGIRILTRK